MRNLKIILFTAIPLFSASLVGLYFGYFKYFEELKHGSDNHDAIRWAFILGLFLCPIGFVFGLIIDLLIWLIITSNRNENEIIPG